MIFTFGPIFTVTFFLLPLHAVLQPIRIQLISNHDPWRLSTNFHKFCLNLLYFLLKIHLPRKNPQSFSLILATFSRSWPCSAHLWLASFQMGSKCLQCGQLWAKNSTIRPPPHASESSARSTNGACTWWSGQPEMINGVNGYLSVVPTCSNFTPNSNTTSMTSIKNIKQGDKSIDSRMNNIKHLYINYTIKIKSKLWNTRVRRAAVLPHVDDLEGNPCGTFTSASAVGNTLAPATQRLNSLCVPPEPPNHTWIAELRLKVIAQPVPWGVWHHCYASKLHFRLDATKIKPQSKGRNRMPRFPKCSHGRGSTDEGNLRIASQLFQPLTSTFEKQAASVTMGECITSIP